MVAGQELHELTKRTGTIRSRTRSRIDLRTAAVAAVSSLAILALVIPRAAVLTQSLWNDEIVSIQRYISGGPAAIFSRYLVDNHMLYDVLAWATLRVPGAPDGLYRLWGSIPFVAAVGIVTWWLRKRAGDLPAMVFLVLAAASPLLLELTTSARGYGLAFLAMSVVVIAAYEAALTRQSRWTTVLCVAAVAGAWTLPILALPAAGVSLSLLATVPALRRPLVIRLAVGAVAVAAWYAPVAEKMVHATGQHYGQPLPWHSPITGSFTLVVLAFVPGLGASAARWGVMVFMAPLLLAGIREARRRMPELVAPTLTALVLTFLALTVGRFFVEVRFLSYLLAPLLIYLALGATALLRHKPVVWQRVAARVYVGLTIGCIVGLFGIAAQTTIARPYENNRGAAALIAQADAGGRIPVLANLHAPGNLRYYLPSSVRLETPPHAALERQLCQSHPQGLIFVQQPFIVANVDTSCLARAGAVRHRLVQRSRGAYIAVWVLPAGGKA